MKHLLILLTTFSVCLHAQVENYGEKGWLGKTDYIDKVEGFMGGQRLCKNATREEMNTVDDCVQSYALVERDKLKDFDNLTEELIFMEAARKTHQLGICQSKLHDKLATDQNLRAELHKDAFAQFDHIKTHAGPKIAEYEAALKGYNSAKSASIGFADDMKAGVADDIARRVNQSKTELLTAQEKLFDLVSRVPMGNRTQMRDMLIKLLRSEKPVTQAQFNGAYTKVLQQLRSEAHKGAQFFKNKAFPDPMDKKGLMYTVDEDLKKSLARSGQIDNVVRSLGLQEKLAQSFSCRVQARYEDGPRNLSLAEIPFYFLGTYGLGRAAVRATIGAAQASTRIASGAYKAANLAAQGAMLGLHSYEWSRVADSVRESCISQEFLSGNYDEACTAETEVGGIYQEAYSAQCLTNAMLTAAPPMMAGALRIHAKAAGKLEIAAAREAIEAEKAAAKVEEPEIVVIGKRKPDGRILVSGRRVDPAEWEKVQANVGEKIENPEIRHYALNELSSTDGLNKKIRTKEVNKLIAKINNWDSKTNTYTRVANNIRMKKLQSDINKLEVKLVKEEPGLTGEEIAKRAEQQAFSTRARSYQLRKMCSVKTSTPAMDKAVKNFAKYNMGISLTSTVYNFAKENWNDVKDLKWASRLGFEVVMSAIGSHLGSKLITSNKGNVPTKIILSNLVNFGTNSFEAFFYSVAFSDDHKKAKAHLEKLKQSPTLEQDLKELEKYLDNHSELRTYVDGMKDLSSEMVGAVLGNEKVEKLTPEELSKITEEKLKDPAVQEKLLLLLEDKAYADGAGEMQLGGKGVDRLAYNTKWNTLGIPIGMGIQFAAFRGLCLMQDSPYKAFGVFLAIQMARQYGTGHYYYQGRKEDINQ